MNRSVEDNSLTTLFSSALLPFKIIIIIQGLGERAAADMDDGSQAPPPMNLLVVRPVLRLRRITWNGSLGMSDHMWLKKSRVLVCLLGSRNPDPVLKWFKTCLNEFELLRNISLTKN